MKKPTSCIATVLQVSSDQKENLQIFMKDRLPTLLIIFTLVLNSTALSNFLIFIVLSLLCFVHRHNICFRAPIKICFLISIGLCIMVNWGSGVDLISIIRLITLCLLVLFYPFRIQLSQFDATCLYLTFLFLFLTHILSALDFGNVAKMVQTFYPIQDDVWKEKPLGSLTGIINLSARYGGIFYNPNIMGQSILFLYIFISFYLIGNNGYRDFLIVFGLSLFSIVLTGSRSALVVFILISLWNFLRFRDTTAKNVLIACFMLLAFLSFNISSGLYKFYRTSRIFSVIEGSDEGSLTIKFSNFNQYLTDLSSTYRYHSLNFLFGNCNLGDYFFDADYGYIIFSTGVVGFVVLSIFFVSSYRSSDSSFRHAYFVFLIATAATVVMNFRFSILLFLLLGLISRKKHVTCVTLSTRR